MRDCEGAAVSFFHNGGMPATIIDGIALAAARRCKRVAALPATASPKMSLYLIRRMIRASRWSARAQVGETSRDVVKVETVDRAVQGLHAALGDLAAPSHRRYRRPRLP